MECIYKRTSLFIYIYICNMCIVKLGPQFQSLGKYLQPRSSRGECLSKIFCNKELKSMKKRATRASSSQHWEGGKFHFLQLRLNFLFTDIFFHLNCSWEVEIHILFFLPQHPYHIFLKDVKVLFIWRCTCLMMCKIYLFQGCVYFKSNHNLQSRLQEYKSRNLRI